MTGETSSLHLGIDATGAKAGADQFTNALGKIAKAVDAFDKKTDVVFAKLRQHTGSIDFSRMAKDLGALSGIRINNALAPELTRLSNAMRNFHAPSAAVSSQLTAFGKALGQFHNPTANPAHLTALKQAITGFRAPTQQQVANLQGFVHALNNMRITANVSQIVSQLHQITVAAAAASSALAGVRGMGLPRVPRPRAPSPSGGGSGGHGGGAYGPRSSILTGPYDGIFSGNNRATGELRGFENMANPSFQAASVLRTMVPALTSGAMFEALYSEGAKLTQFQHTLEIATTIPNDAIESQRRLADAMQFVSDLAMKYGVNLDTVRDGFGRFAAAMHINNYSMKESQDVYANLIGSLRALGVDSEHTAQAMNGVDVMVAKGTVSQMQLTRQLDPVMPGIQKTLADVVYREQHHMAAGTGLNADQSKAADQQLNMIQDGIEKKALTAAMIKKMVNPQAFFDAIAEYFEQVKAGIPTAINSPVSDLQRFTNQWKLTLDSMNKSGVWNAMGEELNRLTDALKKSSVMDLFKTIANGITDALHAMGNAVVWASNHIPALTIAMKAFIAMGALELVMRLGGAFGNVSHLAQLAVSPITFVARALLSIGRSTADVLLGKVTVQAAAASVAMRGLRLASMGVAGALMLGVGGAIAALVEDSNELSSIGGKTQTVGQQVETIWSGVKEALGKTFAGIEGDGKKSFSDLSLDIAKSLGAVRGDTENWGSAIIDIILGITAAAENAANRMAVGAQRLAHIITHPAEATIYAGIGGLHDLFASNSVPGGPNQTKEQQAARDDFMHATGDVPDYTPVTVDSLRKQLVSTTAKRVQDEGLKKDFNDMMSYDYTSGVPKPEKLLKHPEIDPAAVKAGKSAAEKMQDSFDNTLKSLTPDMSIFEKYREQMDNIAKAQKMGIHSKGAEDYAKTLPPDQGKAYLAGEYDRAREGANDKVLESIKAMTPAMKATRELYIYQQELNGAVQTGNVTRAAANELYKQAAEATKKITDPYHTYLTQLQQENSLLLLGNKQREVETQLAEMVKKAKADGITLTQQETTALEGQLKLHQQLQQYQANQNVGLQEWANSFQDLYTELGKVEQKIAGDLTNALTKFVMAGNAKERKQAFAGMVKGIETDFVHMGIEQGMRGLTDATGLTGGPNADPHGSTVLGPAANWIAGLFGGSIPGSKPPAGAGKGDPLSEAMASHGGALPVVVLNKDASAMPGEATGSGGSGTTGAGSHPGGGALGAGGASGMLGKLASAAGPGGASSGDWTGWGGTSGSGRSSSAHTSAAGSDAWNSADWSELNNLTTASGSGGSSSSGGSSGGSGNYIDNGTWDTPGNANYLGGSDSSGSSSSSGGLPTGSGSSAQVVGQAGRPTPSALSGIMSMASKVMPLLNMFSDKGMLGADGMLFGKTGTFGSAGPFSSGGLFGGQGPMFGNMPWTGAGGYLDNTFGATSLVGSNGWLANTFGSGTAMGPASLASGSGGLTSSVLNASGNGSIIGASAASAASGASDAASAGLGAGALSASNLSGAGSIMDLSATMGAMDNATTGVMGLGFGDMFAGPSVDAMSQAGELFNLSGSMGALSDASMGMLGAFAEGGYSDSPVERASIPHHEWANRSIPHYADGVQNTSGGMPAILHPNEAVVPLSRGRKIPVDMGNSGGQGGSGPIHVHFNVSTPDADSFKASQGQINASLGRSVSRAVQRNGW